MLTNNFTYCLPEALIAKHPEPKRTASRLLYLDGENGNIIHTNFYNIFSYFNAGDLLVMNDSKVIPARLFGHKETGGKVEIMLERVLNKTVALAHIRASKAPKVNTKIILANDVIVKVLDRVNDLFKIKFIGNEDVFEIIANIGHIPLPPYFGREPEVYDKERYQTVYAKHLGSVAAPTAGLHFDEELLNQISTLNVDLGYITLHVGAGTFQPLRVNNINEHHMHTEVITVSPELCAKIAATKERGGRVIAVGTTTVRALETAALTGRLQPFAGETDIFIKPDFAFKVVDALITNFHFPMSTLLILTCAFGGVNNVLQAYQEAIKQQYRFYSYGDAMFITRRHKLSSLRGSAADETI